MAETVSETGAKRTKTGLFQPGGRGGPGRPKKPPEVRETERLSREAAQGVVESLMGKALKVVERGLNDPDVVVSGRFALDILDRGLGKPRQTIEQTNVNVDTVRRATPEVLEAAARRILALRAAEATDIESR